MALAIVALAQGSEARFWGLLGLGVLSLGVVLARPALNALGRRRARRHDERIASRALPDLADLVAQFGDLVNPGKDTLQKALPPTTLATLHLPSTHWFNSFQSELAARLEDDSPDLAHFARAHNEFWTLVSAYSDDCVEPVYQEMSADIRQTLTPATRGKLEAFRERYVAFSDAFTAFSKKTGEHLRTAHLRSVTIYRPEPLTA